MDFGRLLYIDEVDFSLPPDDTITTLYLSDFKNDEKEKTALHVGCAKWGRKDWIGKVFQGISHFKQLQNTESETELFIQSIQGFNNKLGYSFLQLSEFFAPDKGDVLQKYLEQLPRDLKVCVELRHEDWFINSSIAHDTFDLFKQLKIGTVITDTAGRRDCLHMKLTAPVAFIRFVGYNLP